MSSMQTANGLPSPSCISTSSTSSLCTALPLPVQCHVDAFLGFSVLMDLRVLSAQMQSRCEQAALQWMATHLSADGLRERDSARIRRQNAARAEVAPQIEFWRERRAEEWKKRETGSAQSVDAWIADVDVLDAVWLRRQLDRWGHCSRDALQCVISTTEAEDAYNRHQRLGQSLPFPLCEHGVSCYRVVDIAQQLFGEYKHAAAIDAAIRPGEQQRALSHLSIDTVVRLAAEQQAVKTATARWTASTTGAAWLSQLPADVLAHSVLGFLDFEQLMGARAVSRGMQRAAERGACAWMNRTFPAGLQRLADEQQRARVIDAEVQQAIAGKKSRKKRKRESEWDDKRGSAACRGSASLLGAFRPPSSRSTVSSSSSSSPVPSSTSSMVPSAGAAVPGVSFDLSDCRWALRQLQWAQRVDEKAMRGIRWEAGACYRATVPTTVALQRFCLRPTQLPPSVQSVQRGSNAAASKVGREKADAVEGKQRFGILALLDAVLGAHGHASALAALRARRMGIASKAACTIDARREGLLRTIKAAFAEAGARWELAWVNRSLCIDTNVDSFILRDSAWTSRIGAEVGDRLHESEQKRTEYHQEGARVHAAMRALGWRCSGHCGWGDCNPRQDGLLTAAQLALARNSSDGTIDWSESDGFRRTACRMDSGVWSAFKRR